MGHIHAGKPWQVAFCGGTRGAEGVPTGSPEQRVSRVSAGPEGGVFQAECRVSSPRWGDSGNIWGRLWAGSQRLCFQSSPFPLESLPRAHACPGHPPPKEERFRESDSVSFPASAACGPQPGLPCVFTSCLRPQGQHLLSSCPLPLFPPLGSGECAL